MARTRVKKEDRVKVYKKFKDTHPCFDVFEDQVVMRWNVANIRNYTELGYKFTMFGDEFDIDINHLGKKSTRIVTVKCPLCSNERKVSYAGVCNAGHTYCKRHSVSFDLTGEVFGRLTAVSYLGDSVWTCDCSCGNSIHVAAAELLRFGTQSCGCLYDDYIKNPRTGKDNPLWTHIEAECPVCKTRFEIKKSQQEKYNMNFCSVSCKGVWQSEHLLGENNPGWSKQIKQCANCGKEFYRARYLAGREGNHFCGSECKDTYASKNISGSNHHQWTSVLVSCDLCKTEFYKPPKAIRDFNFCCREHYHKYFVREKRPSYNPNLSDEEREKNRSYPEYREWRSAVYKRYDYSCVVCGKSKNIVAHHLYSFAQYPSKRLTVDNGVVLCSDHHDEFHFKFMGSMGVPCTKDDFNRWLDTLPLT